MTELVPVDVPEQPVAAIRWHEEAAELLQERADEHRFEAARLMYEEIEIEGTETQRSLAEKIGKSQIHVSYCTQVHKIALENPGVQDRSWNELYQQAKKSQYSIDRDARRRELAARYEERAGELVDGLHACRAVDLIEHVEPGTVDLIFTDPPYPVEFVDCWTELGKLARHALKPGGLLVAYTGQHTMLEAIERLRDAELTWYWCYAVQHTGAFFQMYATRVQCGWKPLLVFRNGSGDLPEWHKDIVTDGQREKSDHDWQQAESEAAYWIDRLSDPDDLVCDPFLGGGTTAVVSKRLSRRFIGCDIDPAQVQATRERMNDDGAMA